MIRIKRICDNMRCAACHLGRAVYQLYRAACTALFIY